jgi:hypothetical protein
MSTDSWQCHNCKKLYPKIGDHRRSQLGWWDRCVTCSIEAAENAVIDAHPFVGWYVDWLKARIKTGEAELREEARYAAAMAVDAEWERRGGQ